MRDLYSGGGWLPKQWKPIGMRGKCSRFGAERGEGIAASRRLGQ